MAATVSSTYPTQNNLNIQIGTSPVETSHFEAGLIEKHNFVYKYRRTIWVNKCFDRITGSALTAQGLRTSQVAFDDPFFDTGGSVAAGTCDLFTPDDFNADVVVVVRVRWRVEDTGGGGGNGIVRVILDDGTGATNVDFTRASVAAWIWSADVATGTLAKNTSDCRLALNMRVTNAADRVEVSHLLVYVMEQGAIE